MSVNVIAYDNLKISTFELEYLKELKITNDVNEHAKLELVGVLTSSKGEEDIYSTKENTHIDVFYIDEEKKKKSIYYGVISNIKIKVIQEVYYLYVEAYSFTYLMDIRKKSRSFQNINMTSHDLIRKVMESYAKSDVLINIPNEPIGELVIQYEETDWEFIKRFVSRYNQGLFPEIQVPNIKYHIGTSPTTAEESLEIKNYTVYKKLDIFDEMRRNHLSDAKEIDYIVYEIQSPKILNLGRSIKFKNSTFSIGSVSHELMKGVLCNTYKIQLKDGLRQKKLYNSKIVGISIDGIVTGVNRDTVQVQLSIDENGDSSYWFPYSTMSASPDGSGWYCMPEINDMVRVYIPSKNEGEAFAISSVSGHIPENGSSDRMGDPSVKYIRTQDDKEVKFTPEGIEINSDSGRAVIKLNEDGTVTITGQNSVNITAQESINIRSEKSLMFTAKESVDLSCDKGGSIILAQSGEVLIKGTEVKNN